MAGAEDSTYATLHVSMPGGSLSLLSAPDAADLGRGFIVPGLTYWHWDHGREIGQGPSIADWQLGLPHSAELAATVVTFRTSDTAKRPIFAPS